MDNNVKEQGGFNYTLGVEQNEEQESQQNIHPLQPQFAQLEEVDVIRKSEVEVEQQNLEMNAVQESQQNIQPLQPQFAQPEEVDVIRKSEVEVEQQNLEINEIKNQFQNDSSQIAGSFAQISLSEQIIPVDINVSQLPSENVPLPFQQESNQPEQVNIQQDSFQNDEKQLQMGQDPSIEQNIPNQNPLIQQEIISNQICAIQQPAVVFIQQFQGQENQIQQEIVQHSEQNQKIPAVENQQLKEFEEYYKELKQRGQIETVDEPEIEVVFPARDRSPVLSVLKTESAYKSPEMIQALKPIELEIIEEVQQQPKQTKFKQPQQVVVDEDEVIVLKKANIGSQNKKIQIIDIEESNKSNKRQNKGECNELGKVETTNLNIIDIIEDSDSEKHPKRKPEKNNKSDFNECSMTTARVAIVRFVGIRRIKLDIQTLSLKNVFQFFFSEKLLRGIMRSLKCNSILNSITPEDVYQYLGIKLMMGYMKFPQLGDYWRNDVVLACPIKQTFEQKYFQQLDSSVEINAQTLRNLMVTVKQEGTSPDDDFLQIVAKKINKKFRGAIQPGQELILLKNQTLQIYTSKVEVYQLIEKESNYICGQIFRTPSDNEEILQEQLKELLKPFEQLNHIIYAAPSLLNYKTITELYKKYIFVCTEVKNFLEIDNFRTQQIYQNGMAFYMRSNTQQKSILVFPNWQTLQSLQSILTSAGKHQLSTEKMSTIGETAAHQQITQTIFQIVLESIVNNTLSLTNYSQLQKDGRVKLSQELLRSPMIPFEKQIIEAPPPIHTHTVSSQTTETHRFPLEKVLHCPLFDGNARCLVCLYEGNLSKTQASCLGCGDTLKRKVFLCVYPCFRKFHIEPSLYITPEEARQIEGYYDEFQLEDEAEQVPASKPERNADLDIIYQMQHRDLDDEQQLLQHGVPVNYEDDFRNKTKWVKVTKPRGGAKAGRGGGGRKRAPSQPRKVNFAVSEQGVQGGSEQPPSALKKGGRGRGRGRPSNDRQFQRSEGRQQDYQEEGSAMMDFFSMVRKKVMTNNQQ